MLCAFNKQTSSTLQLAVQNSTVQISLNMHLFTKLFCLSCMYAGLMSSSCVWWSMVSLQIIAMKQQSMQPVVLIVWITSVHICVWNIQGNGQLYFWWTCTPLMYYLVYLSIPLMIQQHLSCLRAAREMWFEKWSPHLIKKLCYPQDCTNTQSLNQPQFANDCHPIKAYRAFRTL